MPVTNAVFFSFNSLYRKTWVENWAGRRYTMHDRFEALLRLAILPVLQAINGPVLAILHDFVHCFVHRDFGVLWLAETFNINRVKHA